MLKQVMGAGLIAMLMLAGAAGQTADTSEGGTISDPLLKGTDAASTDEGAAITVEGRLGTGEECPIIRTKDGKIYGVEGNVDATDDGAHVRISGTIDPQANFCMETHQVILVDKLEKL